MGAYIDDDDLYGRWGKDNVDEWASLDNQATPTAATRRTTAIAWAEQYVEDRFRNSRYEVPFSFNTTAAGYPVHEWMKTLAGVWLFQTHGWAHGQNEKLDMMATARSDAEREMDTYLAGMMDLDAAHSFDGPTAPHA